MPEKSENGIAETPPCAAKEAKNSLLTNVLIEGLLGVGKVELRFAPGQRVHVLFGANGVGKTKCLEALYQFLLASNKDFWNFAKPGGCFTSQFLVMDGMSDASHEVPLKRPGENQDIRQMWGTKDLAPWHHFPVVFLGAGRRASLGDMSAVGAGILGSFKDRRQKYFGELVQAFQSGRLSSLGMAGDTRAWFIARAQSVNPYQESSDNRKAEIDAVLSMLNGIEACIDPEFLRVDGDGQVFLRVNGEKREFGELSSGYAALVKMTQAIVAGYAAFTNEKQLRNVRGIVLIDEIDAHLHPEWQAKIIPCLKKLLPNTVFYIATHSPLVLVRLMQKEAYLLKRDDDGVVRSREIKYPNRRLFFDVLEDGFDVNLNRLKRDSMEDDDQSDAKQGLLSLLNQLEEQEKANS